MGMHAFEGFFSWLHDRLRYKEPGRGKNVVLLYTFGVNKVGLNQILNTHMPTISKDANYYLQQIN
jgi:hypothetical protein